MNRNELRKMILGQRENLTPAARKNKSENIINNLWRIDAFSTVENIFTYVHFRSEVETLSLIEQLLAQKKQVSVPLTLVNESRLDVYKITAPATQLRPGYCRIPEPDPGRTIQVDPGTIEAVLLPGSVFDIFGGRLGYGGGYYDRFLDKDAPHALRVGLAYELQMVDKVPVLPHDERLDYLVTEKRIVNCSSKIFELAKNFHNPGL